MTSEIAKLESRWRENPQGLTFAPLAEAYRKTKEPQRALELLAEGLAQRPDYIPAVIVLGRCHLDLSDDAAAEAAFNRVLTLDAENVIALKALADITERHLRYAESEQWLTQLLAIDRSNDDARAQLTRVEAARQNAEGLAPATAADAESAAADSESAEAVAAPEAPPAAGPRDEDEPAIMGHAEPLAFEAMVEHAGGEMSPLPDLDQSTALTPEATAPDPDLILADMPAFDASDDAASPVDGLEAREFAPPAEPIGSALDDVRMEDEEGPVSQLRNDDTLELRSSGASEFQLRSASEDFADFSFDHAASAQYQSPDAAAELGSSYDQADAGDDESPAGIDSFSSAEPALEQRHDEPVTLDGESEAESDESPSMEEPASAWDEPVEAAPWTPPVADEEWGVRVPAADDWSSALPEADASTAETSVWDDSASDTGDRAEAMSASADPAPEPDREPEAEPAVAVSDDAPDGEAEATPDLVVTESMAELYLRQGHRSDALTIYRELYLRHPDDLRLREKLDELETTEAAAESGELAPQRYAARHTGGEPVGALFRRLLAARPAAAAWSPTHADQSTATAPPGAEPITGGEPTRPADDSLSLNAIFGDDSSPVPPAVPAATSPAGDGLSFDAFFDAPVQHQPTIRRGAARDDDDLDQFHAWLQNLKR